MSETMEILPACRSLLAANGLDDLDAVFAWERGRRLDKTGLQSWRQRWQTVLPDGEGRVHTFYLKRFECPPIRHQATRWRSGRWASSTAGVEWNNARQLASAGIPSAQPAAFGQETKGIWEKRSFILLREVRGQSLEKWVPDNLRPADREKNLRQRRERLNRLADFVADFHRAGFVHRDLYLSHIFICPPTESADEKFQLIDLQRVFKPRFRKQRWIIKDLAALNFSTPAELVGQWERLRFLCRYVRQCDKFGSARKLAKLIESKTNRIIGHNRKIGA